MEGRSNCTFFLEELVNYAKSEGTAQPLILLSFKQVKLSKGGYFEVNWKLN